MATAIVTLIAPLPFNVHDEVHVAAVRWVAFPGAILLSVYFVIRNRNRIADWVRTCAP